MIRTVVLAAIAAALLSACTVKEVGIDPNMPTALLKDSDANLVKGNFLVADRADFFYAASIEGTAVSNNVSSTSMASSGNGFSLRVREEERRIPARPITLTIAAVTYFAAPISAMFNDSHQVSGEVRFEPVVGETYVVTGELRKGYSAVWIQTEDGRIVTPKIEKKT